MEKHRLISTAAAALLLAAGTASANNTATPRQLVRQQSQTSITKRNIKSSMAYNAKPLKETTSAKAGGVAETVLVNEDFSAMTTGTPEKPDTTQMLACEYQGYSPNGIYLDNKLTKDGTWFGSFVYSAGGSLALKTYNPQQLAYVCTPLGDYSGDLTVTLRVKANPALIATKDGYQKASGSSLIIQVCHGGYNNIETSKTDDTNRYYDVRLYEKEGWQEITYTCKNYSANNDGYIAFSTEGSIVIDDVKIKVGNSFLASPALKGITDFKKDQFTIAWEPTRKAYNYYLDLYKRNYLSDKDTTFVADFNDGTIPAGWETTANDFSDTEGAGNSKGLILRNGDSFTTPTSGNDFKKLHFYLKTIDNSVDPSEKFAFYLVNGRLYIDLKTVDGWKEIGNYNANGFWKKSDEVKLEEEFDGFNTGGYIQLRLRAKDLNEGAYFVLDDMDITAKPPYEYEIVGSEYYQDLNDDYAYTANTTKTEYTFKNLDPNTEYYYGVRSHYVKQFSDRQFVHALGVAAPEAKEATDIDSRGVFTANWEAAPKATGYTVACYGTEQLQKDIDDYPILEEDFSTIDASVTSATTAKEAEPINNSSIMSLDAYTKLPGWQGTLNTLAQGMLGAEGDYDYDGGMIYTPELYLANNSQCKITAKIYGEASDQIVFRVDNTNYAITLPENGEFDGNFTLPCKQGRQSISIYSQTLAPFAIDYLKVGQNLPKGARVQSWLQSADTDASTLSYTFSGLDAYDFPEFGFQVTSHYEYDTDVEVSSLEPSPMTFVDLVNGTSTGIEELVKASDTNVVARYNAAGQIIAAPVKGLNILKMSDGKVMKVIVK